MKGETTTEIAAAAEVMRQKATRIEPPPGADVLDTCGTGGDRAGTFNISTTVAFVAAGAGIPVAKHGNRSVTSRSGSADVLEALGMDLNAEPARVQRALDEAGITFLFAPKFHSAMKYAIGPRREIAIRTIFNILGPISNPAGARRQMVGVFSEELGETYARVLAESGHKRAIVVHGTDGLDEVSLSAPTIVWDVREGKVRRFLFDPRSAGYGYVPLGSLKGGDAETNAGILADVLAGAPGPARQAVVLNAAFAMMAGGKAGDVREGIRVAESAIDTGAARDRLSAFLRILGRKESR
jgi:anthranilate phosphoribosyltransferase